MIGRRCKFWLSMGWRNRVALLSGLSVAMLLLLLRRRCQRLTSCGATGRVGHLKRAIPCYRVSTCGKPQRASRPAGSAGSLNQYFSIHAACVRNASFDINRQIAVVVAVSMWHPRTSHLIYIRPKHIIRVRIASNLFAGTVVLFLPQRKALFGLPRYSSRCRLWTARPSSPFGGGAVAKEALLKRKV